MKTKSILTMLVLFAALVSLSYAKDIAVGEKKASDMNNMQVNPQPDRPGREGQPGRDFEGGGAVPQDDQQGHFRERMMEHKQEFEDWLKTNHPDEAVALEKLQDETPQAYRQKLMETMRKYGPIFRAEKDNPELAAAMKKDMKLKELSGEITDKIHAATDNTEKEKLTAQLQQVIEERFDLIVKCKQLQVKDMEKKLTELQAKVAEKKASLVELQAKKESEVKARMQELLSKQEKINWE